MKRNFIRKIYIWISVIILTLSGIFQINSQEVQAASVATTAKNVYAVEKNVQEARNFLSSNNLYIYYRRNTSFMKL